MKRFKIVLTTLVFLALLSLGIGVYLSGFSYDVTYDACGEYPCYRKSSEFLLYLGYTLFAIAICSLVLKYVLSFWPKSEPGHKLPIKKPWKETFVVLLALFIINGVVIAIDPIFGFISCFALFPFSAFFASHLAYFAPLNIPLAIGTGYFHYFAVIYTFKWLKTKNKHLPYLWLFIFLILNLSLGVLLFTTVNLNVGG